MKIETYKSSGPGGQRKNKRETAVRLRYILPADISVQTGKRELVVVGTRERSQVQNINYALMELQNRLRELYKPVIPRIPTELPSYARDERTQDKMRHSRKKRLRKEPILEDG